MEVPLESRHGVGHSWAGGFSLTHGNFGPVYIAPCFANMEPGNASWIAKPDMKLQDGGAAEGMSGQTTFQWGEGGATVAFHMNVVPVENGAEVKGTWSADGPATGVVQLDMRIPAEVAETLLIEADGQTLWDPKTKTTKTKVAFQEIQISRADDGKPVATISAEGGMAGVFAFREKDPPPVILQIFPVLTGNSPNVSDVQEFSWKLKFAE